MRLTAGQNAVLKGSDLEFTVDAVPPVPVYALVAADGGAARLVAGADAFPGIHVEPFRLRDELNRIPPSVQRISCADGDLTVRDDTSLVATLQVARPAPTIVFGMDAAHIHPAMVCFELYRRDGSWKVRAVGQGYAGGRDEMLRDVGIEPGPEPAAEPGVDPLERMWMVFEDAARSTAGFIAARDHAARTLDEELSAVVADSARRNTDVARLAAAEAQARHDDLVRRARAGYDSDAAHLRRELTDFDHVLPPSLAPWR
ncbi:MAG: TerD family protein, partial [Mycolicibacterium sp.]